MAPRAAGSAVRPTRCSRGPRRSGSRHWSASREPALAILLPGSACGNAGRAARVVVGLVVPARLLAPQRHEARELIRTPAVVRGGHLLRDRLCALGGVGCRERCRCRFGFGLRLRGGLLGGLLGGAALLAPQRQLLRRPSEPERLRDDRADRRPARGCAASRGRCRPSRRAAEVRARRRAPRGGRSRRAGVRVSMEVSSAPRSRPDASTSAVAADASTTAARARSSVDSAFAEISLSVSPAEPIAAVTAGWLAANAALVDVSPVMTTRPSAAATTVGRWEKAERFERRARRRDLRESMGGEGLPEVSDARAQRRRCALGWTRSSQSAHPVWTNPLQALAEPWERARGKVLIRVAGGAVAGGPCAPRGRPTQDETSGDLPPRGP